MNSMPSFGRGDWLEGFQLHPDWMEWTMIMGAIALVVIAAALIALAVKVWLARDEQPIRSIADGPAPQASTYPTEPPSATGSADAEAPTRTLSAADITAAGGAPAADTAVASVAESPRAILDRRYAAGEIDRDEYRMRRADIDDAPAPDGAA